MSSLCFYVVIFESEFRFVYALKVVCAKQRCSYTRL